MDYYLSDEGQCHLPDIHRLANEDTTESDDKLMHYAMEAIRLNGTFGSYRESHTTTTIDDDGRQVPIKPGDKVFVSFVSITLHIYPITIKIPVNRTNRLALPETRGFSLILTKSALIAHSNHTSTMVTGPILVWEEMPAGLH
jgi:hypothetical protein